MKILTSIKIIVLITTTILSCARVLADEPDWQTQNANLSSEQANTAKKNADTAAENANTAETNANTTTQSANTAAQNANTTTQNANTAQQNANTMTQNANTAAQNANTAAQNATTATIMVTPVPAPKEVTVVPAGYVNCFVVEAGWLNGVWIPDHRVCKYSQSTEGVAWIEGYWACTKYRTIENVKGVCTTWDWKPGRWVRTLDVY